MSNPRSTAPYLTVNQGGKEQTVNDAIEILSTLTVGSAISQSNSPPVAPTEGQLYIVGLVPTGAWATRANQLALAKSNANGGWKFFVPQIGWQLPIENKNGLIYRWSGTAWVEIGAAGFVESSLSVPTIMGLTTNTKIPLLAATGTGGLDISGNVVTHGGDGTFQVNAFCALLGVASAAGGKVEVWVKCGSYERIFGVFDFSLTPGSVGSASVSLKVSAVAADSIQLVIKNPTNLTSLEAQNTWIQVEEK
jgi:Protein of unknown function (DUF2793)